LEIKLEIIQIIHHTLSYHIKYVCMLTIESRMRIPDFVQCSEHMCHKNRASLTHTQIATDTGTAFHCSAAETRNSWKGGGAEALKGAVRKAFGRQRSRERSPFVAHLRLSLF